jgi:pyruvate,orthophosphate dikinase
MDKKRIYTFGNGKAEGRADMRNLLGGKGANLAEMNLIGVPVPPGFTITTEVCTEYNEKGKDAIVKVIKDDVMKALADVETLMRSKFGDATNPLLVSVRSGARASMPGMMDTILNLGLNDEVVEGLARKTNNARFAWDSYRRFVQMYGDVVLNMKPVNKDDIDPFEAIIEEVKRQRNIRLDNELNVDELKQLVVKFKSAVKERTGKDFPTNVYDQLWGAICAVFDSWMNERAISIGRWKGYPTSGVLLSASWPWCSVIWATHLLRVYASHATPLQVRTSSTANILSMLKVRMSLPAFVHRNRSRKRVLCAGQNCKV